MNLTPYLIRGLATGGQFALVAIGYTMVYGILKLINFAHGDLFMLSGIMMIYLAASFPTMPMWVTILIMIALTVFVGFAIEKCAYSPLRTAPRMSVMISAIGVSYLLQNLVCYVTGGLAKQFPDIPLISQSVRVFGVKDKLAVFISPLVAVVLMVVLVLIINHTKFGMSMRAVSKDFETAQLTIVPRGQAGGMTIFLPEEDRSYRSKAYMTQQIVSLLGGRAAEELILGDISTGASSDIQRATAIARKMVGTYGMSEKLGNVAFDAGTDEVFIGKSMGHTRPYSEKTAAEMDEEIRAIIDSAYDQCRRILTANREQLVAVAEYLLVHETMDAETFESYFAGEKTSEEH